MLIGCAVKCGGWNWRNSDGADSPPTQGRFWRRWVCAQGGRTWSSRSRGPRASNRWIFCSASPNGGGILDAIPEINWIKHLTIGKLRRLVLQARVRGTVTDYRARTLFGPVTAPLTGMWRLLQRVSPDQTNRYHLPAEAR